MEIRNAQGSEIDALARLWYDSWRYGHAAVVPEELKRIRTPENFRRRMAEMISSVRVAGPVGSPLGFYANKGDELNQLFVSADARGKGVAAALIADAERDLVARGVETAWLACAIGNERAAGFYEKHGWRRARTYVSELPTDNGVIQLEVWRYEKTLDPAAPVTFERADLRRLKELLKVFADVFEEPETYQGAVPTDQYLSSLLKSDTFIPLVAIVGDKVVGGLAAYVLKKFEQERSEIYIYDLAVREEFRRRRIATGLINKLREIAREMGDVWVIYVQADAGDEPAIKLYESLGTREDVHHFDIIP